MENLSKQGCLSRFIVREIYRQNSIILERGELQLMAEERKCSKQSGELRQLTIPVNNDVPLWRYMLMFSEVSRRLGPLVNRFYIPK